MNKQYLTLHFPDQDTTICVAFDANLTFKENFNLLKDICNISINENFYVFYKNIALDKNTQIFKFYLAQYSRLHVINGKI